MKKGTTLVQSNKVTNARYELSLLEKRIIYFLLTAVRNKFVLKKDGDKTLFEDLIVHTTSDILLQKINETNPIRVKNAFKSLRQRSFEWQNDYPIDHPKHEWLEVGFINFSEWETGGNIHFEVSRKILPFFVELTEKFTAYDSLIAMSLRSKWSQRFYEYCCQWRVAGGFNISIEELRKQLSLDNKYIRYASLKKYVIDVARDELKDLYQKGECDTYFEYSELKKGRSVDSLKIKVISLKKGEETLSLTDIDYFVRTQLHFLFKTKEKAKNKEFIDEVMTALRIEPEKLQHCYKRLQRVLNDIPPSDQAKYMRFIIKEDYLS